MKSLFLTTALLLSGFTSFVFAGLSIQEPQDTLKMLSPKDYGQWENIGYGGALSQDGKWLIYPIRRINEENELRLHNLSEKSVKILPNASRQRFSANSQWLGYLTSPSSKNKKSSSKKRKPIRKSFHLLEIKSGDSLKIDNIVDFQFSGNSQFVLLKQGKSKGKSASIIVRNLATGKHFSFGNVAEYSWQDKGSLLAFIVETDDKIGNGLQLFDGKSETIRLLDSEEAIYSGISWRKDKDDLAVFREVENEEYEEPSQTVLTWKELDSPTSKTSIFDQKNISSFPEDIRIVTNASLKWSKDGNSIFFHTNDWTRKPDEKEADSTENEVTVDSTKKEFNPKFKEAPGLQIWHSKDVRIIPEQVQRAERNREQSYLAVWHIEKNAFAQLGDETAENVRFQDDSPILIGLDATPYELDGMFGRGNSDAYSIHIQTGKKEKILERVNLLFGISPDGKKVAYLKNDHYHIYDFVSKKSKNLTSSIDASFVNKDDDHPVEQKPPYGFIDWDEKGTSFLVHSKYDIWQINTDGTSKNLTKGAKDNISNRYVRIDYDQAYVNLKNPIFVRRVGEWTKKSGYSKVIPGKKLKHFCWDDIRASRFMKAKKGDAIVYIAENYSDSPDYFVHADGGLKGEQVSETNPFQKDFHWGKAELIDYKNSNGRKLQGSLFYPDNYDPSKKYPMITYIYERLSDGIHRYSVPTQKNYYNHKVFTSQGYFVLKPDIVFDAGDPGVSSVKTLEIAVKTVVDKGLVDAKKVGLVGHSWGGYQSAFAVTNTDIFAAAVAGAGLTDLVSMYGMVAWAFGGTPENYHFEVSQERMQVPPWEDIEGYVRNSPVFNIDKMNTPLLFEVGDNDKNVDWRQGTEMYNAARRAGKQMVMLVYAKEGHGLSQEKNQIDYQNRILRWFGHYLKGEAAEPWIEAGVPYTEQKKQLKNWNKDK